MGVDVDKPGGDQNTIGVNLTSSSARDPAGVWRANLNNEPIANSHISDERGGACAIYHPAITDYQIECGHKFPRFWLPMMSRRS
jgi:hypothetical protein